MAVILIDLDYVKAKDKLLCLWPFFLPMNNIMLRLLGEYTIHQLIKICYEVSASMDEQGELDIHVWQGIILLLVGLYLANTKHLYNLCRTSAQRLRHWSNIAQMLYKCFVFAGISF